jgi:acyl-[acyl-carrier-protein]-phospholipid O-acyltransferase/long-chain-fatty-acid--[acyl-carrier-protein] ligase
MARDLIHLLRTRRFLPLFVTQALGALNDNVFKNALVVLTIYRLAEQAGVDGQVIVTVAAGLFILPFFLFSATAGQLADKYDKAGLIRWIKAAEVAIMALGAFGFWLGDVWFLIAVLFLMGSQSAFFGPIKYAILPDHLRREELIGGNALVEAGTFVAILIGTIAGGLLILRGQGILIVSTIVIVLAVIGLLVSFAIPATGAAAPRLVINRNIAAETRAIVRYAAERREVYLAIIGISWFWLVGATFLSQFPAFSRDVLGGDETVVTLFLALFSIGIGAGSLLNNVLLKGQVSARYVPLAAAVITLSVLDLYVATADRRGDVQALMDVGAFVARPFGLRIVFDLTMTSVAGGVFAVPLYAIMQTRSEESHRSRVIAANNILNALFMVAGALVVVAMLAAGTGVPAVFLVLALVNALIALGLWRRLKTR